MVVVLSPTLTLRAFLLAAAERGPTAAAGVISNLLWWQTQVGVPLSIDSEAGTSATAPLAIRRRRRRLCSHGSSST